MSQTFIPSDDERSVNLNLGLQGIVAPVFMRICAPFLDKVFQKHSQHKVKVSNCVFTIILNMLSGRLYRGLSSVEEYIKTIPFAAFIDTPDFQPEFMNRFVLQDALDRIFSYGAGNFILNQLDRMFSSDQREYPSNTL